VTTFRISTPVPGFNGEVGGCHFAKGVYEGPVGDGPLAYFRSQGYGVEELDDTPAEVAPAGNASEADWRAHCLAIGATEDQVKDLKRDQLKELAAQISKEPKA
jgi:hypothetical protein